MSIYEAIAQEKFKARVDRIKANKKIFHHNDEDEISACNRSAEEHEQLAEWLEDYKHIKQWKSDIMDSFCKYDVSSFEELIANARNKAIDDFVERLTTYLGIENATKYGNKNAEQMRNSYGTFMNYEIAESIEDVAEQLKAGVTND